MSSKVGRPISLRIDGVYSLWLGRVRHLKSLDLGLSVVGQHRQLEVNLDTHWFDLRWGEEVGFIGIWSGTDATRPLQLYPSRPIVKLITLYEPDPSRCLEFKVRRRDDG